MTRGRVEFLDGANLGGNDAQHHADVAALLEDVDAEAAQAGDAVGHVEFRGFLEFLLLAVGHHAERHGKHFFRRNARDVGQRIEQPVDAQVGMVAHLQMKVRRLGFNGAAQQIVDAQGHGFPVSARRNAPSNLALGAQAGKRAGMK